MITKNEFHIPFIHSMIIIGAVTLVAMASSRYFVEKYLYPSYNNSIFTSAQSEFSEK